MLFRSDVVDFVGDAVGGVVDAVVDVVNDIPVVGDVADNVLGLDPNGGGIVPIVKAGVTGAVLAPVGGALGGFMADAVGASLGAGATQALGSGALTAAAGGNLQDIAASGVGGYLSGSGIMDRVITQSQGAITDAYQTLFGRAPDPAGAAYWESTGLTGDALEQAMLSGASPADLSAHNVLQTITYDDGSTMTFNSATGEPVFGTDYNGSRFFVDPDTGIGTYEDTGAGLGGTPETNLDRKSTRLNSSHT